MTPKHVAINGANAPPFRELNAYRVPDAFVPVLEAPEYADRLRRLIRSEQELLAHVGTTSRSA